MKVTQEKLPASQVGLEIEITPEMSKQAYEKTLQEYTRSANIPGFRKGKVPRQVLIQRFGSTRLKAAVLEDLIEDSLKQAIAQEKIEAIGRFQLRSSFEDLVNQFEPGSALVFSATVDVPPEVKLSQYKGLQVQAEEAKYDPVKVDEVLENYRNRAATLVPVEGRPAQADDVAVVDFVGRLAEDTAEGAEAVEISGGSAEDFQIELVEGKFIPGFIDGIIDMSLGEIKEVPVTFPEGYPQEDLSGKPAIFTMTLKELKEKELPELDDDFAQEISEFETLAELQESLETRFQKEAEDKTKASKEQALLDDLVKQIEVEIPETLVNQEVDYVLTQTAMQLSEQGVDIKQMLTQEVIAQLRQRSRPEAIIRIKRTLALGEVAKRESLQIEPGEVEAKVVEFLEDYKGEDVDRDRLQQVVAEDLLKDKIISWLEENGTVELVPEGSLNAATADTQTEELTAAAGTATVDVAAETVTEAIDAPVIETTAETVGAIDAPVIETTAIEPTDAASEATTSTRETTNKLVEDADQTRQANLSQSED